MTKPHACKQKEEFTGEPDKELPNIQVLYDEENEVWYLLDPILHKEQGIPIHYCPYCRKLPR